MRSELCRKVVGLSVLLLALIGCRSLNSEFFVLLSNFFGKFAGLSIIPVIGLVTHWRNTDYIYHMKVLFSAQEVCWQPNKAIP